MIELKQIVLDDRARGAWCKLPYPGHPKGCPNFPDCIKERSSFEKITSYDYTKWFAVIEEFDLKAHAKKMKDKHPNWSERQCRCLLYWQGGVRKRLFEKAHKVVRPFSNDIILNIPEAHGINIFETMEKVGVKISRKPDKVIKVMLIGRKEKC